jgi:cell wall-associated NlpC family hydrolase
MKSFFAFLVSFFLFFSPTLSQQMDTTFLQNLMEKHPERFASVLKNQTKYEIQILYTQIDRDKKNRPSFQTFSYGVDPKRYFYPASTVKFPASLLALEKINLLKIKGLNKNTTFLTEATYPRHTAVSKDSTSANGLPSVAHYIKKILMVSDNDAHNRLYEWMGQQAFNQRLHEKGYQNLRIIHRLQTGNTWEENRRTNPVRFVDDQQKVLYQQPMQTNEVDFRSKTRVTKGQGYYRGDSLIKEPFDFTDRNFFSLADQHQMLRSVMFPDEVPAKNRFQLTKDDYTFLWKYMSQLPTESTFPAYDPQEFYPTFCKFLMYGSEKEAVIPKNIRIFNKVGDAYGFLLDNAYIVDFDKGVEFMCSAVIYVNEDQIFNDDKYEYTTVGWPFLKMLGQTLYEFECKRPKKHLPDLSNRKFVYDKELATQPNKQPAPKEPANTQKALLDAQQTIKKYTQQYAPDKRTALFQIEAKEEKGQILLTGKTNLRGAKDFLMEQLQTLKVPLHDQIKLLPEEELGERTWGIVSNSVGNIRGTGKHSAELVTQTLLGTVVNIWEKEGSWYLVQTPDKYLGWIDGGAIHKVSKEEADAWKSAPKALFQSFWGFSYAEANTEAQTVSDLVFGNLLKIKGEKDQFFQVQYPDGRLAFVPQNDLKSFADWQKNTKANSEQLTKAGKKMMGVPYLWGGTSTKGMDCSGFTKTCYLMNGLLLPRDASQQALIGDKIDTSQGFGTLKVGDLLFFGTEKVVHVAMWIGQGQFLHAGNRIEIGSVEADSPFFDEFNFKRFLFAKRILGTPYEKKVE